MNRKGDVYTVSGCNSRVWIKFTGEKLTPYDRALIILSSSYLYSPFLRLYSHLCDLPLFLVNCQMLCFHKTEISSRYPNSEKFLVAILSSFCANFLIYFSNSGSVSFSCYSIAYLFNAYCNNKLHLPTFNLDFVKHSDSSL